MMRVGIPGMRLLILNQYFPPDRAATATLLGQLAEDLSATCDVTVVCGTPTYAPEKSVPPTSNRLRVIRIPLFRASRSNPVIRIVNYVLFMAGARIRTFLLPKHDVVLCWTDPPVVGMLGVGSKWLQRSRFVFVSQDVYPEVAIAMKRMNSSLPRGILRLAGRIILRSADAVVAVGHDMKRRLVEKGCHAEKIQVIPNWHDLEALRPADGKAFRRRNGVAETAFVVMHAGNVGFSQDFDTLLEAAALTRDDPEILYFIVGDGGREAEIRCRVGSLALTNLRMLPYQPTSQLADTLSGADVHYVSLRPELTGYIVPSKVYAILAVGRPIVSNVSADCDVDRVVREARCGVMSDGTAADLARKIVAAKENREELRRLGENGRKWSEENGGRVRARKAYSELLRKVMNG